MSFVYSRTSQGFNDRDDRRSQCGRPEKTRYSNTIFLFQHHTPPSHPTKIIIEASHSFHYLLSALNRAPLVDTMQLYDVIVIGAGFSGLSAAQELIQKNSALKVVVLEARDRIGGRTYTHIDSEHNIRLDLGATWIHGVEESEYSYD